MAEILRFSTLDHPEYLDIKGEYRLQLEQYLKEWIIQNDDFLKTCRVIFYSQIENDIPVYTISCIHNRESYHNPDGKKLLQVFEEYVKNNAIHTSFLVIYLLYTLINSSVNSYLYFFFSVPVSG